uniref:DUF674 domain-containing protein n=1 Tax=Solanum lycopersicum TaxID=4081 RepID=A0A3Q7HU03_SOLLC
MATSENKLSMKLLIDTKAKKVVFAEVEKDFVDFLFHILSLPVGRVNANPGVTCGFVKEMVMDDLVVKPMSAAHKLLKLSFESKAILTSIYMSSVIMNRVKMEKN